MVTYPLQFKGLPTAKNILVCISKMLVKKDFPTCTYNSYVSKFFSKLTDMGERVRLYGNVPG